MDSKRSFTLGMRHGIPIGLGYLAVSFSLGIAARGAGMTPVQGFIASLLTLSSSGEYAGFRLMTEHAAYIEVALMTLVANARYMLMSCSLSQKFSSDTPFFHRLTIGAAVTDELFGLAIGRPGALDTAYYYGAMLSCAPLWGIGTALGIVMGSVLPAGIVSALSVALYGMFIAIVIPAGKKNRTIMVLIVLSFLASTVSEYIPPLSQVTEGTRIIVLTVVISAAASLLRPVAGEPAPASNLQNQPVAAHKAVCPAGADSSSQMTDKEASRS